MTETQDPRVAVLEAEYSGEPSPRRPALAFLLGLLCPGAGWAYVGRVGAGVVANVLSVALWAAFVIVWSTRKFYPAAPLKAFAIGWCALVVMAAFDAWRIARNDRSVYVLRESNHPLVYAAIAVFTFALPLLAVHQIATRDLWAIESVGTSAMYPTLVPGDRILVDLRAPAIEGVRTGDIVLYALADGASRFGRVLGLPGDEVAATWDMVFRNDVPATRGPLGAEAIAHVQELSGETKLDVAYFVETIDGAAYPIVAPRRSVSNEPQTWSLGRDEFIVLNDNRADLDDSRVLGVVRRDEIIGRPVFVGFSTTAPIADLPFAIRVLTLSERDPRFRADRHGRRVQPVREEPRSG